MRLTWFVGALVVCALLAASGPCGPSSPQPSTPGGWEQVGSGIRNTGVGSSQSTTEHNHHDAGRVAWTAWAFDKAQQRNILWVGASHGGLWKSTVDGSGNVTKWTTLTDNFTGPHTIGSFVVHRHDSDRILIATGSTWGDGDGVYATDDGGATWTKTPTPVSPKTAEAIVDDRGDSTGDTVLVATASGILRTTSFGAAWTRERTGNVTGIAQDTLDADRFYAGIVGDGVDYSNDGGKHWCPLGSGIPTASKRLTVATSGHFVYALVVGTDKALAGVFRYDTSGGLADCDATHTGGTSAAWKLITDTSAIAMAIDRLSQASHTAMLGADPDDPDHVVIGLQTIAETHNATAANVTWVTDPQQVDSGHHDLNHALFLPGTHTIVLSNDGGYYLYDSDTGKVDDTGNLLGINALELSSGSKAGQGRLAVAYDDPDAFAAGLQDDGLFVGDRGANQLRAISGGDGGSITFAPVDAKRLAFSTTILTLGVGGQRFVSSDSGTTDDSVDHDIGGDNRSTMLIDTKPGVASPNVFTHSDFTNLDSEGPDDDDSDINPSVVFYRDLADTSSDWSPASPAMLPNTITELDHTTNPSRHDLVATVKSDHRVYVLTGARSDLGALALEERTPDLPMIPASPDARIAADKSAAQPDTLYYTSGKASPHAAFISFDTGKDWHDVLGDLPGDLQLFRLAANPNDTDQLYLATNRGIWRSLDGGTHWTDYSKNLRVNEVVDDVVINADNADPARLYVATRGRGFYTRTLENHAPTVSCEAPVSAECAGPTTQVSITTHVDDLDGDELVVTWKVDGITQRTKTIAALAAPAADTFTFGYTKGNHLVTVTADDGQTTASCFTIVDIVDTTPPVVTCSLGKSMLWPPNHDLVNVGLVATAIDRCDGPLPVAVAVSSDEDDQTTGGGELSPDAKGFAPGTLRLRSERNGASDGRVYLVATTSTDGSGNASAACCTAEVPHDESAASRADVQAQAAAAAATCPMAPGNYAAIGDGPIVGPKQ